MSTTTLPKNLDQLPLFRGMSSAEKDQCLQALSAHKRSYKRGCFLFSAGDIVHEIGIVLNGSVTIEGSDLWGQRTILSYIGAGEFFAEVYAITGQPMMVDVHANENVEVLFLDIKGLQSPMFANSHWAALLNANLLDITARKNMVLSARSFHTAPKTIRERVLAYLSSIARQQHTNEFDIPFDRQQMADYLNVDRTALSKELSKLRDEGIIDFRKNHFTLVE